MASSDRSDTGLSRAASLKIRVSIGIKPIRSRAFCPRRNCGTEAAACCRSLHQRSTSTRRGEGIRIDCPRVRSATQNFGRDRSGLASDPSGGTPAETHFTWQTRHHRRLDLIFPRRVFQVRLSEIGHCVTEGGVGLTHGPRGDLIGRRLRKYGMKDRVVVRLGRH